MMFGNDGPLDMLRRTILALLSIFFPPLPVAISRGAGIPLVVNLAIASLGVAVFFLLYAGPGLLIYVASIAHGAFTALFTRPVAVPPIR
jgi:uncharacterized membrane protein YqaE (UPF0057 family)